MLADVNINNYITPTYEELFKSWNFQEHIYRFFARNSYLDFIITTRYHGAVIPFMHGIPALMFNLNEYYKQKNGSLCKEIGLDKSLFLYDLESLNTEKVIKNMLLIRSNHSVFKEKILDGVNRLREAQSDFYSKIKNEFYTTSNN